MIVLIKEILEEIILKYDIVGNQEDIAYQILSSAVSFNRAINYVIFNNDNFSFNNQNKLVNNSMDAGIDAFDIKASTQKIIIKFNQSKTKGLFH